MAEKDRAGVFLRYLHCTCGTDIKVLSQVPMAMQVKRKLQFSEEKELLWNKVVQDFSMRMKLTMKHNGWKQIRAI